MPTKMKWRRFKKIIRLKVAIKSNPTIKRRGRRKIIIMTGRISRTRLMIIKIMM